MACLISMKLLEVFFAKLLGLLSIHTVRHAIRRRGSWIIWCDWIKFTGDGSFSFILRVGPEAFFAKLLNFLVIYIVRQTTEVL